MQEPSTIAALKDIFSAFKRAPLVGMLGWQDVRQRYRRSALGPFWLTISMGVMIGTIGFVFGQIFKSPLEEYFPFLALGIVLWSFVSSVITEGCSGFISAEGIIKQLPIPLFFHILRLMWRNILILGHNIVIFPLVLIFVGKPITWVALLSIPGFLLVLVNLAWMAFILSVLCTRYRDLPQMIGSILQVLFHLTPIMWLPSLLPERAGLFLLDLNPAYHLIEIARAPLFGQAPTAVNWQIALAIAAAGWFATAFLYARYKGRIAYWL